MIKIEEGLELKNPTTEIISVTYRQDNNLVALVVSFKGSGCELKHVREYVFNNKEGVNMTYNDVITLAKTNEVLNKLI